MSRLRALILDFDGVILESNDFKTDAFARTFGRFPGHTAAMMAYHQAHVSETRFLKFRHLVHDRLGRPEGDSLVDELAATFSQELRQLLARCALVPGAEAFLHMAGARVPLFLASVTPQDELEWLLTAHGLTQHFARVYGCPPWTKTTAIADILETLGGTEQVLFIGDSAGDQRAAAANGIEFIARDSGLPFDAPRPPAFADMHAVGRAVASRLPAAGDARRLLDSGITTL